MVLNFQNKFSENNSNQISPAAIRCSFYLFLHIFGTREVKLWSFYLWSLYSFSSTGQIKLSTQFSLGSFPFFFRVCIQLNGANGRVDAIGSSAGRKMGLAWWGGCLHMQRLVLICLPEF